MASRKYYLNVFKYILFYYYVGYVNFVYEASDTQNFIQVSYKRTIRRLIVSSKFSSNSILRVCVPLV